ncbi:hypothetical protein J6590_051806 [Homalodisca vitripennis]|nr:hypothetical protein J6590_051806 [Homalodisca vitripennis]
MSILPGEVRAKKPSLTFNLGPTQPLKGDFRTNTNGWAGVMFARTGSLSGHPSKQQPRHFVCQVLILQPTLIPDKVVVNTVSSGNDQYHNFHCRLLMPPVIIETARRGAAVSEECYRRVMAGKVVNVGQPLSSASRDITAILPPPPRHTFPHGKPTGLDFRGSSSEDFFTS